jgi:hypothetical protein
MRKMASDMMIPHPTSITLSAAKGGHTVVRGTLSGRGTE